MQTDYKQKYKQQKQKRKNEKNHYKAIIKGLENKLNNEIENHTKNKKKLDECNAILNETIHKNIRTESEFLERKKQLLQEKLDLIEMFLQLSLIHI